MQDQPKHPGGRPPKFETPEQLKTACDEFIELNPGKLTITGLAMYLGFDSRQSLYDYEKREEFSYIIKEARLAVENDYEKSLRLLNNGDYEQLRFALRSITTHHQITNCIIVGGKPKWFIGDHIPHRQKKCSSKELNQCRSGE